MKGFAVIIVLVSVGSSLGFDECVRAAREAECNRLVEVFSLDMKDAKGLDLFCQIFQSSLTCLIGEVKKCSKSQSIEDFLENNLQYVERSCNPDSEIYQVISNNIQCISSEPLESACSSNETIQFFLEHKKALEERGISEECQYGAFYAICDAVTMGDQCGEEVGFTILDILMNIRYGLTKCPEDILERIPGVMQAFFMARKIENEVVNEIKKT